MGLRDLLDIELIPFHADRSRRIGKSLKCLQSQPADGFWAISREIPFPLPIQVPNTDCTRASGATVGVGSDLFVFLDKVGGKFADDFFENILKRDQTENVSILIYHHPEPFFLALKVQ